MSFTKKQHQKMLSAGELIIQLSAALKSDGDFPVSARIAHHIAELTKKTNSSARDISTIILKDPTLAVRVLQVANSSLFTQQNPITSVAQAVVLLGMVHLSELCTSLVLLDRFIPLLRQGGHFAVALHRAIVKSVITSLILRTLKYPHLAETGHLSGMLSEVGPLLLAFYYPQQYEIVAQRGGDRHIDFSTSLLHLCGASSAELSRALAIELQIPTLYGDILLLADDVAKKPLQWSSQLSDIQRVAMAQMIASRIGFSLANHGDDSEFRSTLGAIHKESGISLLEINSFLSQIQRATIEFSEALQVEPPEFPPYLSDSFNSSKNRLEKSLSFLSPFESQLIEMREAFDDHQPASTLITMAMEALHTGLGFDRVIFLAPEVSKKRLLGKLFMSSPSFGRADELSISLLQTGSSSGVKNAFTENKVITRGEPLLSDAHSFIALPVGNEVGVIYADRLKASASPHHYKEVAGITSLGELLGKARSA